ncbi:MAG: DUF86 domain-containing protein [Bacteroidales bacterium]|nr:DUF86 domain-containing protein [Bacteroidales bacterium]
MKEKANYIIFRLKHIIKAIDMIDRSMTDVTVDSFLEDEVLQSAVCYQFLIIGEAVRNLPVEFTEKHDYPWYKPRSFRNFLAHEYFGVDMKMVYYTQQKDMPGFRTYINELIEKTKDE